MMTRLLLLVMAAAAAAAAAATLDDADSYDFEPASTDEPSGYAWNASFPHLGAQLQLGQVSGVFAVNDSHIYVFHRADRKWELADFDEQHEYTRRDLGPIKRATIALLVDGRVAKQFGEGLFFMPHSIAVDAHGNIWTTDTALHQVFKFSPSDLSRPSLVLGERFKPGKDAKHFCQPTDVKVSADGHVFVSDGYCNARIMRFAANGSLLHQWGHSLSVPHGLALDERDDTLLVADRQNARVVAFSASRGEFKAEWQMDEPVYGVAFNANTDEFYVLKGEEASSDVLVLDYPTGAVMQLVTGADHDGFGMGHAISATDTGFVVGSVNKHCSPGISCALNAVLDKSAAPGAVYLYSLV